MRAGLSPARQARAHHRHQLRSLTYVTLDEANGGIVRNLTHEGIAVQAVAALRPGQKVRVRFELRHPRLRVEILGEVMWATASGQCGIRFLDLPPRLVRQINEWIFGNLLEGGGQHFEQGTSSGQPTPDRPTLAASMFNASMFNASPLAQARPATAPSSPRTEEVDDGLIVSPAPRKVIELPARPEPVHPASVPDDVPEISPQISAPAPAELDWLSQPLSGRALVWTVNTLVVVAALLLFTLVFLSVTRELPRWPVTMAAGAALVVAAFYWGFFKAFAGASLGTKLARLAGSYVEEDADEEDRFR